MEDVEKLLKATMSEIEHVLSTNSVVGDKIVVGDVTMIPLVSLGFGFGAGGGSGKGEIPTSGAKVKARVPVPVQVAVAVSSRLP